MVPKGYSFKKKKKKKRKKERKKEKKKILATQNFKMATIFQDICHKTNISNISATNEHRDTFVWSKPAFFCVKKIDILYMLFWPQVHLE